MNPYSTSTELKLILTALQNIQPKFRNLVLGEAPPKFFGNRYIREIRTRMDVLLHRGKSLGSSVEEWHDEPGLSQDAKDILKGAKRSVIKQSKFYNKDRVDKLLHNLKLRYRLRIALKGMSDGAAMLEGKAGETQLEAWYGLLQNTLEQVRSGSEKSEKLIIGEGQSNASINRLVKRYTKKRSGQYISLGMPALDLYYHGAQRGNVITLSANSGGGKSAVALNMAINQVRAGHSVCYCSMEMDNDENMHRLIANQADMDHGIVQVQEHGFTKKQKSKISNAIKNLHRVAKSKKARLVLWDVQDSNFTPQQLELEAKPYHYDVIYVDYITLFGSTRPTETWKLHLDYSRYLKGMAKRLNCVVVILAQLSDDEQLRYGKAIRDNTDFWFYWTYGEDEITDGYTELKTGKARNHRRRHCTLNMNQLSRMIVHTVGDDVPDPSVITERAPTKPRKEKKLLGKKRRRRRADREVSKEIGFKEESKKGRRKGRRPAKDPDGP